MYDVTSCLISCSFQGVSSLGGVSSQRGGVSAQRGRGSPLKGRGFLPDNGEGLGTPLVLISSGGYYSNQYASYWNAFFLFFDHSGFSINTQILAIMPMMASEALLHKNKKIPVTKCYPQ